MSEFLFFFGGCFFGAFIAVVAISLCLVNSNTNTDNMN